MHRSRRRGISKGEYILRRALIILAAILAVVVILIAAGRIVTILGKNRLEKNANTEGPTMVEQQDSEAREKYVSDWKEGWVSLDDKIYEYNDEIRTFLVLGIDNAHKGGDKKYDELTDGGQADGIFLVVINPADESMKVLAVNRDTDVDVVMVGIGENGDDIISKAEISVQHAFGGGREYSCELTRDAVSKLLYNIPIHAYMSVNYKAIPKINDAVGGVTVTMPEDYSSINKAWTQGAEVTLKGEDSYDFVHVRDTSVFESQRMRLGRQKLYLKSFIRQMKAETKKNITLPVSLYNDLKDYIVTDLTVDSMGYMASEYVDYSFDDENIYTMEGETKLGDDGFEHFYPDEEALRRLVIELFYREVKQQ